MTNIPSNLMRYWRPEPKPADAASPPAAPSPRPCRWADCANHRTGALFCNKHAAAANRASDSGTLPPMDALVEMRPSQIAALTAPPPPVPPPAPPAAPPPPAPVVKPRVCLWPDCGRSAGHKSLCSRCKARRRRLIQRGLLTDAPLTPSTATGLSALWQTHLQREHVRQREQGWPKAAPIVAKSDASLVSGPCVAVGCDRPRYARGLCTQCYRRATYRGQLGEFRRVKGSG